MKTFKNWLKYREAVLPGKNNVIPLARNNGMYSRYKGQRGLPVYKYDVTQAASTKLDPG